MSVVRCQLLRGGTRLSLDEFSRATVTRVYQVETNGTGDGEYTVAIQSTSVGPDPIPHMLINSVDNGHLSQYNLDHGDVSITGTTDTTAYLTSKEIVPWVEDESQPYLWKVTCKWTPMPFGYAAGSGTGSGPVFMRANPLNDPVVERSEHENYRRRAEFDINGSAIANSAGDLFNDAIVDDHRPVLVLIKNMPNAAAIDALSAQYKNAINTDSFRGHAPLTLKVESITKGKLQERLNPATRTSVQFMPMIVKMHKAETSLGGAGSDQTWLLTKADVGAHVLVGGVKVAPKVLSGTSQGDFLDYVNLDTDGTRLPDGQQPKKKTFQVYPELPFSSLGLV